MSRNRLPLLGPSGGKLAKPPHSSPALLRKSTHRKRHQQKASISSSSRTGPPPIIPDESIAPWGGPSLSESSFTFIVPPPPHLLSPQLPLAPQPTPSTPFHHRREEDEELLSLSFDSSLQSPSAAHDLDVEGGSDREKHRVLPENWAPRPARLLPPLRPITNLSFSRSFTFSFFELPQHQSARGRAEHIRHLMLLLRQIHY